MRMQKESPKLYIRGRGTRPLPNSQDTSYFMHPGEYGKGGKELSGLSEKKENDKATPLN